MHVTAWIWIVLATVTSSFATNLPSWRHHSHGLRRMLLSEDGVFVFVTSDTTVNQLLSSNLTEVASFTEPDDVLTTAFNFKTDKIVVCSNGSEQCGLHLASNISVRNANTLYKIKTPNAKTLISGGKIFIACPHTSHVPDSDDQEPCSNPGIFWKSDNIGSGFDVRPTGNNVKFKPDYENVKTTRYFAAIEIGYYRWFFSRQNVSEPGGPRMVTRVAQLCTRKPVLGYDMEKTYVDMEVRCGQDRDMVMKDVTKFTWNDTTIIVAVFTSTKSHKSAICVYHSWEITDKFVENINRCYKGVPNGARENYLIRGTCRNITQQRNGSTDASTRLCEGLALANSVIGQNSLEAEPVLEYNVKITAIAVMLKRREVVAFLGTANNGGQSILKAVVYPEASSRKISTMDVSLGFSPVREDMFITNDQSHVIAMTNTAVYRIPVQQCSRISDCSACLQGADPHCGWCILKIRCTTEEDCGQDWILAGRTANKCPSIVNISTPYLSVDKQTLLIIDLLHLPHGVSLQCLFHNTDVLGAYSSRANVTVVPAVDMRITCQSPNIQTIASNIQGSFVMGLSILTNVSSDPIIEGNITYFHCDNITSCDECTRHDFDCNWCVYEERCEKKSNSSCSGGTTVRDGSGECPYVTSVHITAPRDDNGLYYMSSDKQYVVRMTGHHFPQEANIRFTCQMPNLTDRTFPAFFQNETTVECALRLNLTRTSREKRTELRLYFGQQLVIGSALSVCFYACEGLVESCGKCKSLAVYEPHYRCRWCNHSCVSDGQSCNVQDNVCPPPIITNVSPLSAVVNTSVIVTITGVNLGSHFNETKGAVSIANIPCASIERLYTQPSERISCELQPSSTSTSGDVSVTLPDRGSVTYTQAFHFRIPTLERVFPNIGPQSGGTTLTIYGQHLDAGNERVVHVGHQTCVTQGLTSRMIMCVNKMVPSLPDNALNVMVTFDNSTGNQGNKMTFRYLDDPVINDIEPRTSFMAGGRSITVRGTNLHAIQRPKIYATFGTGATTNSLLCSHKDEFEKVIIICPSPCVSSCPDTRPSRPRPADTETKDPDPPRSESREKRQAESDQQSVRLGFEMDGVESVKNLPDSLSRFEYFQDPEIHESKQYKEVIIIKGDRLAIAATQDDVFVYIVKPRPLRERKRCNVTSLKNDSIYCEPPDYSALYASQDTTLQTEVQIGYLRFNILLERGQGSTTVGDNDTVKIGVGVGIVVILIIIALVLLGVLYYRMRQKAAKERTSMDYKMDRLEATYRNQCREEFAVLQTAVSDLTSDLEGGNVLFRDYPVYACKTLFASRRTQHPILSAPPQLTSMALQALDNFKALLRNTQFLLMFVRTLEKEKTFTIHDRSNVATLLTALNHDNLEFITDILKTLLNDLVDKNVAAQTPKLMLRRSESVSEKLLTHWLSVCLYHHLKERSGSPLFILYKAMKTQIEKGPVDYITGCAKYTLSEDKLFTSADTAVNAKTLTLHVSHFHHIDNEEKQIDAAVLDCDTVTQVKAKMLEILYKNTPYSQRPSVHNTLLEIKEEDGTARSINDEDSTSLKEGLWKKINTLLHYGVADGTSARLVHSKEAGLGMGSLITASPDAYIVGSYRKAKPVVRTVSGSNYWHLTKQNPDQDEVKISSDFFLPRLINTKGTLLTYVDELFTCMLTVGPEPPIIIKYLYDFLDAAAERHSITDPDVLHTWKCNSVLLRFWVNILKNPEFVFDIHKPNIVDSCLSVVAQTLMDSCSTSQLILGKDSPPNKLLFAREIPRYKELVKAYFEEMRARPAVSDQDLNSFLTEMVSQKFSGSFNTTSALLEMYHYAEQHRNTGLVYKSEKELFGGAMMAVLNVGAPSCHSDDQHIFFGFA